jgi:MHS family proline/betaine transporter-like MFS transporter
MATLQATAFDMPARQSMAKAVLAGSIGNTLEWFDYGLYAVFAPVLSAQFFPSKDPLTSLMLTFVVFGVGFVMRPLGGLIFGHIADKHGRRAALTFTVVLIGASTFAIGCLPTFAAIGLAAPVLLAACRLLQGVATGGEFGSCMSFLAEYGTPYNRAYILSWSNWSVALGLLMGTAFGTVLSAALSQETLFAWGWRIPFLTGLLIALYGVYIRRGVDETPVYVKAEAEKRLTGQVSTRLPVVEMFASHPRETWMTIGMVSGGTITYWTTMAYLPTYITAVLKYPLVVGLSYGTFVLLIYMLAVPFAGILCDRIGRRPTMLIAYGSIVVLIWPMFYLLTAVKTPLVLFPVLVVVAIIPALFLAGQTAWLTEAFPTSVRGSACGVGYNIGVAIFGGSTPFMATWLISMTHDNMSPTYYMMLGGLVSTLIVYFFVRETNRREL